MKQIMQPGVFKTPATKRPRFEKACYSWYKNAEKFSSRRRFFAKLKPVESRVKTVSGNQLVVAAFFHQAAP